MPEPVDLTGLKFKGEFFEHPERVKKYEKEIRGEVHTPEEVKALKESVRMRKKHFKFELFILHYDPSSGLFIARGLDHFGESGVVGVERDSDIQFCKYYPRNNIQELEWIESFNVGNAHQVFRKLYYSGNISLRGKVVNVDGCYRRGEDIKPDGFWHMYS